MYYDKQGKPIKDTVEWAKLFGNKDYKIIKQEYTDDKKYWVSTVWLGLDHSFSGGSPLVFETMVFLNSGDKKGDETEMERYSTLEEAETGHKKMFEKWNKKIN